MLFVLATLAWWAGITLTLILQMKTQALCSDTAKKQGWQHLSVCLLTLGAIFSPRYWSCGFRKVGRMEKEARRVCDTLLHPCNRRLTP